MLDMSRPSRLPQMVSHPRYIDVALSAHNGVYGTPCSLVSAPFVPAAMLQGMKKAVASGTKKFKIFGKK